MKNDTAPEELPEAPNQKELEQKIRELLGPPPQEATEDEILESRGVPRAVLHPEESASVADKTDLEAVENATTKVSVDVETPESSLMIVEPPINESDQDIIEDKTTSDAVDDIVADEADAILASEDAEITKAFVPDTKKPGINISEFFKSRLGRRLLIIFILLLVVGSSVLPASRYYLLNLAGVRASVSLSVSDDASQQPLKNIEVSIGGSSTTTDSNGLARLSRVKLGKSALVIHKRAYADVNKAITVGWGSNPIGSFSLKATGIQYSIVVKDFLSGKPVTDAEAGVAEAISTADNTGKILLSIDPDAAQPLLVTISSKSYRSEKVALTQNSKAEQKVNLVPSRKSSFISKRSGKYDLYKIDVDGKNESLVLKGTGSEQDNMVVSNHPSEELVAYVSTRDNAHNKEGFLLSTLLVVDLNDNSYKTVVQSERIQLVGWSGDDLTYFQVTAGTSAFSPKRYRLVSYNVKSLEMHELATGNYFNDTKLVGANVYYAVTGLGVNEGSFNRISVDGSSKQQILGQIVWSIYRSSYDRLTLSIGSDWYDFKVGTSSATKLASMPSGLKNYVYVDSSDKKHSLWVDERDGKSVLLSYDTTTKSDKILKTQGGITNSLRWLNNNTVMYRVHTDQETADYVISTDGGNARKVSDVTNTINAEQGYY